MDASPLTRRSPAQRVISSDKKMKASIELEFELETGDAKVISKGSPSSSTQSIRSISMHYDDSDHTADDDESNYDNFDSDDKSPAAKSNNTLLASLLSLGRSSSWRSPKRKQRRYQFLLSSPQDPTINNSNNNSKSNSNNKALSKVHMLLMIVIALLIRMLYTGNLNFKRRSAQNSRNNTQLDTTNNNMLQPNFNLTYSDATDSSIIQEVHDLNIGWYDFYTQFYSKRKEFLRTIMVKPSRDKPLIHHKDNTRRQNQQMVIIAGPHYTGAADIQAKLWEWTTFNSTKQFTQPILNEWVWPIPEPVANDEFVELEENKWTPAQVYYPLIEAIKIHILRQRVHHNNLKLNHYPQPPSRLVYQKYSLKTIFSMFHDTFQQYWSMGYSLVLGTEALNHIVKFHELGDDILHHVSHKLIPSSIPSNQTTVVISYQTPRIEHLLSAWRDISGVSFHDWIVNGYTGMYSILDALGMVEKIIFQTNWNVALVDIKGVQEQSSQDMPTYIACHIMNSNCNDEGLIGFDREVDKKPITRNPWLRQPDIPEGALEEIEKVFLAYDCKYKYLLKHHRSVGRLKVYQSYGMDKMTSFCDKVDIIPDIKQVKELISNIVKRYHEPSNSIIQTT